MEVQSSRERVLRWIARQIVVHGENAAWVTGTPILITKASLSFPAKVRWAVVRAQLRPTCNDNTMSPSLASLVACLMAGYQVKVRWIIATEMRDRALNERVGLPFPCRIGKLCIQAGIPPKRLIDRWGEAFRLTQASKIKDVDNHLFGAKSGVVGSLAVVPHVPLDIPHADRGPEHGESSQPSTEAPPPLASASQAPGTFVTISMFYLEKLVADQRQTRTLVDQIVHRMHQLIERDVLAAKKEIKDEMQKEMVVIKDMMDGLEILVQDRFQAVGSVDNKEFKSQLAEIRAQVAKLAEKPVQVPTPVMPESLMQLLNQAPFTQSLDDFWGEIPKSKFGKRKHKAEEFDEELSANLSKEERRQQKKARKASRKEARKKEAIEQQQRDAVLAGATGSGVPIPVSGSQPDPALVSESAPVDKGVNADPTTGA
uniref:Putative plant transposon protein domain-containing protein n=1 Tax=Solanum tuberosum TaxID=4113 RepID=M1DRY0_SOLTU